MAELQTLVGRLNHASYIIPLARHFLRRLRQRLHINQSARQHMSFSKEELADLLLWTKFLLSARNGISLNNLTLRRPSQIGLSDSCPFGMGGFTWTGRAWRLRIPETCLLHGVSEANNVLEFLAMALTIWLVIIECRDKGVRQESILSLGDNTSAIVSIGPFVTILPSRPAHSSKNCRATDRLTSGSLRPTHSGGEQPRPLLVFVHDGDSRRQGKPRRL
jgi:hypothetical protein